MNIETAARRVALITDTKMHLGPDLARILGRRGHDLLSAVLSERTGRPVPPGAARPDES